MSRFVLTAAASAGAFHYRAGDKLADSTANAQPGDKINAQLCASPFAGMESANVVIHLRSEI